MKHIGLIVSSVLGMIVNASSDKTTYDYNTDISIDVLEVLSYKCNVIDNKEGLDKEYLVALKEEILSGGTINVTVGVQYIFKLKKIDIFIFQSIKIIFY